MNEEVRNRIQNAIGVHDDLTMVKKRKLRWYGHISRSSGMAKTILQGTVKGARRRGRQKKRWEDNIKEWSGMGFGDSLRAVEDREGWKGIVATSSMVPRWPPRLRDWNDELMMWKRTYGIGEQPRLRLRQACSSPLSGHSLLYLNMKWAASWQNQQNGLCAQWRLRTTRASAQSDQSLHCALLWVAKDTVLLQADSKDRLIWLFAGHTGHFIGFVMRWLKYREADARDLAQQQCSKDYYPYSKMVHFFMTLLILKHQWATSWENLSLGFANR